MSQTFGKYQILEEIGRGGFATVYKVRDPGLNRIVALKVLHPHLSHEPNFATRFKHEAQTAANLHHPNIVAVYDAGEIEGQLYLAMTYLPGPTLRQMLDASGPLPLEQAIPILTQIAKALDYAHSQDLVHRDVKPGNVIVHQSETKIQVTLLDFGLVKALAATNTVLTSQGTLLGSPEYMAPEQADPNRMTEVGSATDRYALGIVAYHTLCGRVPFPGNTPGTLNAHENKPLPPPRDFQPDLPEAVADILLKALAKSPPDRYPTAVAFAAALQAVHQAEQQEAELRPLYQQLQKAHRRKDWPRVLQLGSQIQARTPNYQDVPKLLRQAERQTRTTGLSPWGWGAGGVMLLILACLFGLSLRSLGDFFNNDPTATPPATLKTEIPANPPSTATEVVVLPSPDTPLPPSPTPTDTPMPTITDTPIPTDTPVPIPTDTPVPTITDTPIPTDTPVPTPTDTPVPTITDTPIPTDTPMPTATDTLVPTITDTPIPTDIPTPTLGIGSTQTRSADGMTMLYVPGGTFRMGSAEDDPDAGDNEKPQHTVTLTAFWIDRTEVTNAQYKRCVEDGVCAASPYADDSTYNGADYPVIGVFWQNSVDYCDWAGGRLPTEAEWEYAARGPEGRKYPWGNDFDAGLVNSSASDDGYDRTAPVGAFPEGASWIGAMDMAGNVWEWVNDWYGSDYYATSPSENPIGPQNKSSKVLRGGSWGIEGSTLRTANRFHFLPDIRVIKYGFRCVREVERGPEQ